MEKECEICGAIFEAVKATRQYCDKCQKHSTRARQKMEINLRMSRSRLGDDMFPVNAKCIECGKEMQIPKKWAEKTQIFCSQKCREKYRMSYMPSRIKKPALKAVCKMCGKEFEGKRTFCSQECYAAYLKQNEKQKKVVGDISLTCKVCGKEFIVHKEKPVYPETLPKCCSDECRREASRFGGIKGGQVSQAGKQKREELLAKEKRREYLTNGLCAYCRTSYTDCERMQTEFRVIPEGARFNRSGKIIECPKFKE